MSIISTLKEECQIQFERYYRTRYGKIVAICWLIALYQFIAYILKITIPRLLQYVSEPNAYIIIACSALFILTVVYNTVFYCIYTMKIPFFEQYRDNPDKPWPWEENRQKWYNDLLWRNIRVIFTQIFIIVPILLALSQSAQFYQIMDVDKPTPLNDVAVQLIIMFVVEDLWFFTTHKIMHLPAFYKYHKTHHQYIAIVSIAGLHSSLTEFIVTNSLSNGICSRIAALYAPMHVNTSIFWIVTRVFDAFTAHSGYMFSWTPVQLLPFCTYDDYHDYHHVNNSGNFSSRFRYLDIIFGSYNDFRQFKLKQKKLKDK